MGLDYYYSVMPTMAWLVAAPLSDHDEAYTIFLLCDVAEPPARATVTKSSQDLIRSDHVIIDITARWLCLNPSRAFSNFCGGRDLATFPALAEYKEREKLRTEKRESERERERETGPRESERREMLIWSRTRSLSTRQPAQPTHPMHFLIKQCQC